jgi:hypothetical protein
MTAHELFAKYRAHWQAVDDASLAAEIALWDGTLRGEALMMLQREREA